MKLSDSADSKKLAEFIASNGLKPGENAQSYIFDCPKCGKAEKLWMYKVGGRFRCWYCAELNGFKGKAEFALAALLNRSASSIRKELYGSELTTADLFFDFELTNHWSDEEVPVETPDMTKLTRIMWSPDHYPIDHPFSKKGAEYLAGRGIPLEIAKYYDIHYGPIESRVAFPVAYKGSLFGWQARTIGESEWVDQDGKKRSIPKVLSTDSLSGQRDKVVQFADQLTGTDQAIICEGAVDSIKCFLCNPKPDMSAGGIATMGKAVSQKQIALLKYSGIRRVYLALDPDAEAEVTRLAKAFEPDVEVYLMKVPKPYKDFGECSFEDVRVAYLAAQRINPGQLFFHLRSFEDILRSRKR